MPFKSYHYILLILVVTGVTVAAKDLKNAETGGAEESVFNNPVNSNNPSAEFFEIHEKLGKFNVLRADFKQEKSMKALKAPLITAGDMIFSKSQGIYWHITAPVESEVILKPEAISYHTAGDDKFETVTAAKQPRIREFSRIINSIFENNLQELQRQFELYFYGSTVDWTIGLHPKPKMLKKLIRAIVVRGAEQVNSVSIENVNGDSSVITFTNVRVAPPSLTAEEIIKFAH